MRAGIGLALVLYWLPTIAALFLARLAGRLAFHGLSLWVGLLVAVGARDMARRTVERALRRCEARVRALGRGVRD